MDRFVSTTFNRCCPGLRSEIGSARATTEYWQSPCGATQIRTRRIRSHRASGPCREEPADGPVRLDPGAVAEVAGDNGRLLLRAIGHGRCVGADVGTEAVPGRRRPTPGVPGDATDVAGRVTTIEDDGRARLAVTGLVRPPRRAQYDVRGRSVAVVVVVDVEVVVEGAADDVTDNCTSRAASRCRCNRSPRCASNPIADRAPHVRHVIFTRMSLQTSRRQRSLQRSR